MNKRQAKPLIPPIGGRWARVGLTALLTAFVAVGAQNRDRTVQTFRELEQIWKEYGVYQIDED